MKIIFMLTTHFGKRYLNDLYIDKISKYYEVEMWSLLELNKEYNDIYANVNYLDLLEETIIISTYAELDTRLKTLDRPIIFTTYFNCYKHSKIFNLIKKNKGIIIELPKNPLNNYLRIKNELSFSKLSLTNKLKKHIYLNKFLRHFLTRIKSKPYIVDYCLAPPNLCYTPSKKHVNIHHVKYDDYLGARNEKPLINEKYAVFLDSNFPYLVDIIIERKEKSIEANKYFDLLNNFFNYIEKRFQVEIVISAHPKSLYETSLFNNRRIIKYETANLIQHSQFVITHDSTSNINAILCFKPLIFICYHEMFTKGTKIYAQSTIRYAKLLKSPLIDLENKDSIDNFDLNVDKKTYDKFIKKFVVNDKERNESNEILINKFLDSIHTV